MIVQVPDPFSGGTVGWRSGSRVESEMLGELFRFAGCGGASRRIAERVIDETGSLAAAVSASEWSLRRLEVPGEAVRVLRLMRESLVGILRREAMRRPQLGCGTELLDYLHAEMAHALTERFRVLFLDSQNGLIRDEMLAEGSVGHAPVQVREVVRRALEIGASALILVHNHPSGDPAPSAADVALTRDLIAATRLLDIAIHDHIVVGRYGHASLRALGLLGTTDAR